MEKIKSICLFSGGLDSILAIKVLEAQGIDVQAIKFISPFFGSHYMADPSPLIQEASEKWQISLEVVDITEDYFPMLKAPDHGYGKNFNPCIDCKILMIRKAKEIMETSEARFIATGEVIGQRPMSQRRDIMRVVERDSGVEGLLLRPLSGKLLPETLPEIKGWVDRERLFDFSGRGRSKQIELAKSLRVTDYPSPAGGCILTDPALSKRIEYMVKTREDILAGHISLCRIGRHFVWPDGAHLVVARNQAENERLATFMCLGKYFLRVKEFPGPLGLLWTEGISYSRLDNAAGIVSRYSKARRDEKVDVLVKEVDSGHESVISVSPLWELENIGCKHL